MGQRPSGIRPDDPRRIRRQAAGAASLLLEGPSVGQQRPAFAVEPAGLVDDGSAQADGLGRQVDRFRREGDRAEITPHNGYHSEFASSADTVKWVAIDLGEDRKIDAVQLDSARPYDYSPDTPGFLFPVRFKIEAAGKADFSDAKTVVDQTAADVPNPGLYASVYRFEPITARHVRLTVTRLARREGANFAFALAEMQVLSGSKNVAKHCAVTALDSIEAGGWSKDQAGRWPRAARGAAAKTTSNASRRCSARNSTCAVRSREPSFR